MAPALVSAIRNIVVPNARLILDSTQELKFENNKHNIPIVSPKKL